MSIIRLVTFDVTGTLLRPCYSVGRQYAEAAQKYLGVEYDEELLQKSFVRNYSLQLKQYPCFGVFNQISTSDWWFSVFSKCFTETGVEKVRTPDWKPPYTRSQLHQAFEHVYLNFKWNLLPGTEQTLKALKNLDCGEYGGMKLAAISNSDERTSNILSDLGILKYFDTVVTSVEAKCEKPDPKIFNYALRKLNILELDKNQILHVGNTYKDDYLGAVALGMHALLLMDDTNGGKKLEHESHGISDIRDVLSYIKMQNSRHRNVT